jgi:hypothetical protein
LAIVVGAARQCSAGKSFRRDRRVFNTHFAPLVLDERRGGSFEAGALVLGLRGAGAGLDCDFVASSVRALNSLVRLASIRRLLRMFISRALS